MRKPLCPITRKDILALLLKDPVSNDVPISNLMRFPETEILATGDLGTGLGLDRESGRAVFWGDWQGMEFPGDLFEGGSYFVAACPMPVLEILREVGKITWEEPCWHFLAPAGYGPGEWDALGPLEPADTEFIAPFWDLSDDPLPHIKECVERYDSACLRLDGKPVSWCGLHFEIPGVGNLGFAHTLEEHRGRGYASMVTKALVNRLAARNMRATAHVIKSNEVSIRMCGKLGFRRIGEAAWLGFRMG